MWRAAAGVAAVLAVGYLALCALMYLQQRSFIYFPQLTRADPAGTDFAIERGDAVLRGWIVNPGRGDPILYFGGNAESVELNRADFSAWFPERSVYLLAYRGYGASDGEPRERDLQADALEFYDAVSARHPGRPVSLLGRSLGSGMAGHVAARRPVDRLALVTPFDSMTAVAQAHYRFLPVRLLLRERYRVADELRDFHAPVLVLRAGRDEVIPARNGDALIAALPQAPEVLEVPEAGHNDLSHAPEFGRALSRFFSPARTTEF